ncbi:hypothetical protein [Mycolicibacterium neoaurum]|uniref:hypothetical protein n=1 Tax=Mycolicibacterium neoaurum TaxID=1795 RepID=UPI0012FED9D8|nr:hypothetical protein [Mycolicibacterium neoaurum]
MASAGTCAGTPVTTIAPAAFRHGRLGRPLVARVDTATALTTEAAVTADTIGAQAT